MEPTTILALLSLIGGTAMQYKATEDAAGKQRKQALAALQRQEQFSEQGRQKAMEQAQDYQADNRSQNQEQISDQMQQEMLAPVESANQINAQTTTTQGDVSDDYVKSKAQSEVNLRNNALKFSKLMGNIGAAGRLRQNEAVDMARTSQDIGRIGSFANGMGNVDRFAIQQAGNPDAGMALGGSLLQGLGTMGLASAMAPAKEAATAAGSAAATETAAGLATSAPTAGPVSGWAPPWQRQYLNWSTQ